MTLRLLLAAVLAALLALTLAGCGKKGKLEPPPGDAPQERQQRSTR